MEEVVDRLQWKKKLNSFNEKVFDKLWRKKYLASCNGICSWSDEIEEVAELLQ